ncbi:MAG: UvrD-helicase domain-containing protein [Nitrospirae bacterium]|nr:UvrD-helicase domain-containing protein [Candidatus Manganitrophaceae bacterium]
MLKPFVGLFHEKARQEAWVSFDALLVKARDLLRDHPSVRENLKQRFQAILIDEFQDTDPVQYEILLYLAEEKGQIAKNWQAVKLAPGKLFVVGDPKQSIYGFRRADIEAYHAVRVLIFGQGGVHCTLSTNFRSHGLILNFVNGIFEKVMIQKAGIQPEYIAIQPPEFEETSEKSENSILKFRQVSLRLIQTTKEKWNADTAKQREGEAIAQWLSQEVLGKVEILGDDGKIRHVKKEDVAILMRTLTGVRHILQPLRRLGIAYWVEGEKHFYRKQVVIDAVNLLRVVADANDKIALVAVLRSPLGGLDDDAIYVLEKKGLLNYRRESALLDAPISDLYAIFSRFHDLAARLPVAEAVSTVFDECTLRLLAAASNDGAQALANLKKIEEEVAELSKEETMTFQAVVFSLRAAVDTATDTAESPLAEAGIDAVKVFSIHKAKGLEFPLVILAGCHAVPKPGARDSGSLRYDWSSDLTGLRLGEVRDLNAVFLKEKVRLREIEEEKRLLYVAMTRAREHLMISAAPSEKIKPGSFLSQIETVLAEKGEGILSDSGSGPIKIGDDLISRTVLSEIELEGVAQVLEDRPASEVDDAALAQKWENRFRVYDVLQNKKVFISPTQLKITDKTAFKRAPAKKKALSQTPTAEISAKLGQLAHRFLETWDFSSDPKNYKGILDSFLNQQGLLNKDMSPEALFEEMDAIFKVFFFSPAYAALSQVKIVDREVPFFMPWQGQVMQGEIDLIYEEAGKLYIADYKTDRIKKTEIQEAAKQYHHQCQIYPEAVRRALQREVAGMKLIFLRLGLSYSVSMGA